MAVETVTNPLLRNKNKDGKTNLSSYFNQLQGKDNSSAAVGSSSSAANSSYSNYLTAQNASLQNATKGTTSQSVTRRVGNKTPLVSMQGNPSQTSQPQTPQPQSAGTSASNSLYASLSQYDQKLPSEAQAKIVAAKQKYQAAQALGDKAAMQDAYIEAQLTRAMYGGYIDDIGDGSGYAAFGYANLSAADRAMSQEDQDAVLKLSLLYKYADNDADRAYYHDAANKIRSKYGYTSKTGADYTPLDPLTTEYGGYDRFKDSYAGYDRFDDGAGNGSAGGSETGSYDGKDTYTERMNQLNEYVANREYDPENDPAYLAYKRQYERNASAAANSALAQAAGNTGGIANSYATSLAAAAQQSYMKQLTDVIPTLQQQDYADKLSLISALGQQQAAAFDRYQSGRDFDYQAWQQYVETQLALRNLEWEKEKDVAARDWSTGENQKDRDLDKWLAQLR